MKLNKKKIIILIIILLLLIGLFLSFKMINNNDAYSYEWVKEKDSVINQQRLYVNNKRGKHINGYVRITYLNDNSRKEEIKKEGKLFVRSVIKKVKVINRRN